jgi:hypothetical protein
MDETLPQVSEQRSDLDALKDGAAMMAQAGNRVAALALLWAAAAIDPIDLAVHRRLAALLAHGGDVDGAAGEYARYIEFLLPLGEVGRATAELAYGANMLGGHPALQEASEKIVVALRAIVARPAVTPSADAIDQMVSLPAMPPAPTKLPFVAPRLLPKVPFSYCVHSDGARQWLQLEGGTGALVPTAVRMLDDKDNVLETRLCLPLAADDERHARVISDPDTRSVAWVVIGIPDDVAAALDASRALPVGFQAKVGDEWLSLELLDTGCRHGRARSRNAS